jgi:hypothetical protein
MIDPLTRLFLKISVRGARSAINHFLDKPVVNQKPPDELLRQEPEDSSIRRERIEREFARRKELELISRRQHDFWGEEFREILNSSICLASVVLVFHVVTIGITGAAIVFVAVSVSHVLVLLRKTRRNPSRAIIKYVPSTVIIGAAFGIVARSAGLSETAFVCLNISALALIPED